MPVDNLLGDIAQSTRIEGVTVIGGEPFEQAAELRQLLSGIKTLGLTTVVMTGYKIEELRRHPDQAGALDFTDVLIDGSYKEDLRSFDMPMAGSSNQRFFFLSDAYRMDDFPANAIEVRVGQDGVARFNGMGDYRKLNLEARSNV